MLIIRVPLVGCSHHISIHGATEPQTEPAPETRWWRENKYFQAFKVSKLREALIALKSSWYWPWQFPAGIEAKNVTCTLTRKEKRRKTERMEVVETYGVARGR